MKTLRFEDGLATLFEAENGDRLSLLLALAERSRLAHRIPDWLARGPGGKSRRKLKVGWFGDKWISEIETFWKTLSLGTAHDIHASAQAFVRQSSDDSIIEFASADLVQPLILLERGPVVAELHDELLEHGAQITIWAAPALAESGDWEHALAILTSAHRHDPDFSFGRAIQDRLWKHAYLQGFTATVLPRLAAIPFDRRLSHAKELRAWELMAYQIRAGITGVRVPVIEPDRQSPGYDQAAAMQIAALEGDPSEAKTVEELRRVLRPRTVKIDIPERGLSFELRDLPHQLFKAEVQIAARRKDHARAVKLARLPSQDPFVFAPDVVIDAYLEESDWRQAAAIADLYDPRERPVVEGLDDDRLSEYRSLQLTLAAAAARSGDDAAARAFLHLYALSYSDDADGDLADLDVGTVCPWAATMFSGAAEGIIPRHLIAVLLPVIRC